MSFIDFHVYYTASALAVEHRGNVIYSGSDTGVDPQQRFAAPETAFARKAHQLGLKRVMLYVYPPMLADALTPLTLLPLASAAHAWLALNLVALCLIAFMMTQLLHYKFFSVSGLVLLIALLVSQPVMASLTFGQITIVLLLLWTWGTRLYQRGSATLSAVVFALAAAVKLTPLIVIVPILIWRDLRWLRAFALSGAAMTLIMCLVNTPSALVDYFMNVVPSMSSGIPLHLNESILSSAQCLYLAVLGEPIDHASMPAPHLIVMVAKLASLLVIAVAGLLVWRHREDLRMSDRSLTLALFAMLSASASPVAWRAAYTVALLALALLWGEALHAGRVNLQVILLAVCTVAITSYTNEWVVEYLMRINFHIAAMLVSLLLPWTAVLLVLHRLSQKRFGLLPSWRPSPIERPLASVPQCTSTVRSAS
jgi:hypothetical protein